MVIINYVISREIKGYISSCNEKAKALFYCDMFEKTNLHANDNLTDLTDAQKLIRFH
jgi:hypothetical protein